MFHLLSVFCPMTHYADFPCGASGWIKCGAKIRRFHHCGEAFLYENEGAEMFFGFNFITE